MRPLTSLYRIVKESTVVREAFHTSWDEVERVAPEAMVAWDARGDDVDLIGLIAKKWPYVRDDKFHWWVWIEHDGPMGGDWVPWNVSAVHPIVTELVGSWGIVQPIQHGSFFNVLPPDFDVPSCGFAGTSKSERRWWDRICIEPAGWALQAVNDVHGVSYSQLDQTGWGAYRSPTPQILENVIDKLKDSALKTQLQRHRGQ